MLKASSLCNIFITGILEITRGHESRPDLNNRLTQPFRRITFNDQDPTRSDSALRFWCFRDRLHPWFQHQLEQVIKVSQKTDTCVKNRDTSGFLPTPMSECLLPYNRTDILVKEDKTTRQCYYLIINTIMRSSQMFLTASLIDCPALWWGEVMNLFARTDQACVSESKGSTAQVSFLTLLSLLK